MSIIFGSGGYSSAERKIDVRGGFSSTGGCFERDTGLGGGLGGCSWGFLDFASALLVCWPETFSDIAYKRIKRV